MNKYSKPNLPLIRRPWGGSGFGGAGVEAGGWGQMERPASYPNFGGQNIIFQVFMTHFDGDFHDFGEETRYFDCATPRVGCVNNLYHPFNSMENSHPPQHLKGSTVAHPCQPDCWIAVDVPTWKSYTSIDPRIACLISENRGCVSSGSVSGPQFPVQHEVNWPLSKGKW